MRKIAVLAIVAASLVGCGDHYVRQVKMIEWFFSLGETGGSRDWLLVKHNLMGGRDPIGVFFGLVDDREFCLEIAEMYNRRYSAANLYCEPAN